MSERPLAGLRVVLTRPADEAGPLAQALEDAGAAVLRFPALSIEPPPDPAAIDPRLAELAAFDVAIFISPTAVRVAFERMAAIGRRLRVPPIVAAVGPGTAAALAARGVGGTIVPEARHDSEGLLDALRDVAVAGKRIALVRGVGGRETLGRVLAERGARVEAIECYVRAGPAWPAESLGEALERDGVDAVVALSAEAIERLLAHLGPRFAARLRRVPIVVPHSRVGAAAGSAGFSSVSIASGGERDIVRTLGGLIRRA